MIEQNSFKKISNKLEILIIQHFSSPKTASFVFFHKKPSSMKQADLRGMFKKASKSVCISTTVTHSDPLSTKPSDSSPMKNPENTEEAPDDSEPGDQSNIKMEYSFD